MEYKDPYKEFTDAWHQFVVACWDALHIPQIVEWMTKQLSKIK